MRHEPHRYRLIAFAALIAALWLPARAEAGPAVDITRQQAIALQKSGEALLFVDVRTPEEFAAGHVPGAVNIPRDQLQSRLPELESSRDRLVVYCERGPRAAAAAATLQSAGFTGVRHLAGDMAGWRAAGLPIEK